MIDDLYLYASSKTRSRERNEVREVFFSEFLAGQGPFSRPSESMKGDRWPSERRGAAGVTVIFRWST